MADVCKFCNTEVLWRTLDSGATPMTRAGRMFAHLPGEDGKPEFVLTDGFIKHKCDPKRRANWNRQEAERLRLEEDLIHEKTSRAERAEIQRDFIVLANADYVDAREEAYRRAANVDCPSCPAKEAEECLNLNTLAGRNSRRGKPTHTSWPHPARVLLAEKEGY